MRISIFFLSCCLATLFSCGISTYPGSSQNDNFNRPSDIENPDNSISLIDHLRRVPGVRIDGNGSDASISIRGISSINSSTEPLFVVNGQAFEGGLSAAIQIIPVQEIKSINVLKNPSETGIYGVRGANGVIEIFLKKS